MKKQCYLVLWRLCSKFGNDYVVVPHLFPDFQFSAMSSVNDKFNLPGGIMLGVITIALAKIVEVVIAG